MLSILDFSEASLVWQEAQSTGLLDESDTSAIFYSFDRLDERLNHLKNIFPSGTLHAIAIKTNPHPAILRHIIEAGFGLEAASMEEVKLAVRQGIPDHKLVFDSPVKTRQEIMECHSKYPGMHINVNSLDELDRIPDDTSFHIGIRINPSINIDAPSMFRVSGKGSKFGVSESLEETIIEKCLSNKSIDTLHIHLASEFKNIKNVAGTMARLRNMADRINKKMEDIGKYGRIKFIDIGGGYPASLNDKPDAGLIHYAEELEQKSPGLFKNYKLITEFGRFIHTNCGWAVSNIEYIRSDEDYAREILLIHLGGDFFTRQVYSKDKKKYRLGVMADDGVIKENHKKVYDIAGPLCFADDIPFRNVILPQATENDKIIISDVGANTYALWSRHCSRDVPKIIGYSLSKDTYKILSNRRPIDF